MADTYFPLRSNASSLVAGSAANAVVRRIKAAALLGDVLIEEGTYTVNADSTRGSFGSWSPPQPGDNAHWQSARERARHKQTPFGVTAQREGAQTPPATLVSGLAEISWRATFAPVKAQLPHAYPWIRFDHVELPSEADQLVRSLRDADQRADAMSNEPLGYVRNKLLEHVSVDSVTAYGLSATVSMDRRHAPALRARARANQASVAAAPIALGTLYPKAGELPWEEVDRLRKLKGWADLRAIWAEIGQAASELAEAPREFEDLVHTQYEDRMWEAFTAAAGPTGAWKWLATAVSLIVGSLATVAGVPVTPGLMLGIYSTGVGLGVDRILREPTPEWPKADRELKDAISRKVREDE